jgi:hypothetical protein
MYHDAHNSFPPARGGGSVVCYNYASHLFWLMPYTEQSAFYNAIVSKGVPNAQHNDGQAYNATFTHLLCPSDGNSKQTSSWVGNVSKTNYVGSWGDSICQTDESAMTSRGFYAGGIFVPLSYNDAAKRTVEPRAAKMKENARALCMEARTLKLVQDEIANDVPAFRPYAQIDDEGSHCHVDD